MFWIKPRLYFGEIYNTLLFCGGGEDKVRRQICIRRETGYILNPALNHLGIFLSPGFKAECDVPAARWVVTDDA